MAEVVPAGWYPDPLRRYWERRWDGEFWTDEARDGGAPSHDAAPQIFDGGQRAVVSWLKAHLRDEEQVVAVLTRASLEQGIPWRKLTRSFLGRLQSNPLGWSKRLPAFDADGAYQTPVFPHYAISVTDQRVVFVIYDEWQHTDSRYLEDSQPRSQVLVAQWLPPEQDARSKKARLVLERPTGRLSLLVDRGRFSDEANWLVEVLTNTDAPEPLPAPSS